MTKEYSGLVMKSEGEKRLVSSVVLVPGEPDFDGEVVDEEKVAELAHEWLRDFRALDVEHNFNIESGVAVVESYLTEGEREIEYDGETVVLQKGSWVVVLKIDSEELWDDIKSGKLKGLSIAALREEDREKYLSSLKSKKGRVKLGDLGEYFTPLVSLVKNPAVSKARFYSIKSAVGSEETEGSLYSWAKVSDFIKVVKEYLMKEVEVDMSQEEIRALVEGIVSEQLETFISHQDNRDEQIKQYVIELVEEKFKEKEGEGEQEEEEKEEKEEKEVIEKEEYESAMKSFEEKIEELEKSIKGSKQSLGVEDEEVIEEVAVKNRLNRDVFGRPLKK